MKMLRSVMVLAATVALALSFAGNVRADSNDALIESTAKSAYVFRTYLAEDAITITSNAGVVTLSGKVASSAHKELAGETVARLKGVKSVVNNLVVGAEETGTYSDAWVLTKVKLMLLFHSNVRATHTIIEVRDGVVTLRGEALNAAQKDLTAEYAKDVDGVKSVNNEMAIVPATAMKPAADAMAKKVADIAESVDDASITALVKTTLRYHRSTSAMNPTVETSDGKVTLGGKAKNAAEKDLAAKLTADVRGVKSVVNNMTVQ